LLGRSLVSLIVGGSGACHLTPQKLEITSNPVDGERTAALTGTVAQEPPTPRAIGQFDERSRQGSRVAEVDQKAALAVDHQIAHTATIGGHDGQAAGRRFQRRTRQTIDRRRLHREVKRRRKFGHTAIRKALKTVFDSAVDTALSTSLGRAVRRRSNRLGSAVVGAQQADIDGRVALGQLTNLLLDQGAQRSIASQKKGGLG
jgi:hypothetical protein